MAHRQTVAICLLSSCVALLTARADERPRWAAPPLQQAVSARDGRSGELLSFDAMLDALAEADVVFLGESHTDETTHRVELAVYKALIQRRNRQVVLAMEMFERDVQPYLDAYLSGSMDEASFLAKSRPWSNYRTAYRPLIELAKQTKLPVIASNFPRPLRMKFMGQKTDPLKDLDSEQRKLVPRRFLPNSDAYWRRADNATRGHSVMMRSGDGGSRLYSVQSLWDNSMGEACADALTAHPGNLVLHINGGFHSEYWNGTVHQLKLRKPDAKIKTVAIVPTMDPAAVELEGKPVADFVVLAEARATDVSEGTWSVYTQQEVKYRLHMPHAASSTHRVPLLIWLCDDGFTAADGLDLWKDRLGSDTAIVVVEAPYRETQGDFSIGGRWFWPDSFTSDVGGVATAVERIWGYVLRHYAVDPNHVCVAGEGAGATVVAGIALLTDRIDLQAVAVAPTRYSKLKEFPLPLPELWGEQTPPKKSLQVIGDPADQPWWTGELEQYTERGISSQVVELDDDPWRRESQEENAIRQALGLTAVVAKPSGKRLYLLADPDLPRQRHWARLHALWAAADSDRAIAVLSAPPASSAQDKSAQDKPAQYKSATELPTKIRPESFSTASALPKCPGPFGGTTVIVVSEDEAIVKRWLAVAENDPLSKSSRFHRMRVATLGTGDRSLASVLTKLKSENRKNILIVPGVFCADPQTMQKLERSVRDLENEMTLHWLPGLGGCKIDLTATPTAATDLPLKHTLTVSLTPNNNALHARDRIDLPESLRKEGTEFTLHAGMKIAASNPDVEKVGADAEQGMTRYRLRTVPDNGLLEIEYAGTLRHELSAQKEEYTRGFRETKGYVGSEGVYLDGGSGWVPHFNDQLIQFSVDVNMPQGWQVISQGNGVSCDDKGMAHWNSGGLMEQVYLVGGPLRRYVDAAGATETLVLLHEQDDALARKYLDATAQYLEMYRTLIGPYPYEKFALVENFWETGYGMPSFTLLGPRVIRFPFILHSSYPHEILHNWWGNSVFVDYTKGNWCEGMTAYLADHLIQEQRGVGADYRRNALQKYRNYVQEGHDFPLTQFRQRHSAATEAVGYGKALMMFHMLRRQIGDDAFRKALVGLYRNQKGKRASFDDLRVEFETASERELKPFFAQWTQRTGAPALKLENVTTKRAADGFSVRGTLVQTQQGSAYSLQVPLSVQTEQDASSSVVTCTGRRTEFSLAVDAQPVALHVDPAFDLFRILDPREIPSSIGQIFGDTHILAVLPAGAAEAKQRSYRELVEAWQSEHHAIDVKMDSEITALPSDRCVWVLGRANRFAADLLNASEATRAAADANTVRLNGHAVPFADHSIVLVRRHPQNREKAVGMLVIEPDSAFPGVARKLPHYGKYSYLAFAGAEPTNVVKGQWGTTGSPLVVDLRPDHAAPLVALALEKRESLAQLPAVFSRRVLLEHVTWLAAAQREGRGLGSQGLEQAAEYIARQMKQIGLQPGGDNGTWFQTFTVARGPEGKPVQTRNVVGILPGTNEAWKDQSIVLGAHYDHLGFGWPDQRAGAQGKRYPGADDNASGVAVMLELARNLAASGGGARSLVCVAFSAEECGRFGSQHYVAHPSQPAEQIRGMINLDTVGRLFDGKIAIHAAATADEWQHIFRGCGFVTGIPNQIVSGGNEGSDQMSFIEKGIPAVQIFTGAHADYHRPTDTVDKIDASGLVKVATFVKEAVVYMLEREEPLTVRIASAQAGHPTVKQPIKQPTTSGRRVLVGTVPAFDYPGEGAKVDALIPDSPAAKAGLQAGDVIVRIDRHTIRDLRGYSDVLKQLKPNQTVTFELLRDGKKVQVKVTVAER